MARMKGLSMKLWVYDYDIYDDIMTGLGHSRGLGWSEGKEVLRGFETYYAF